MIFYYILCFLLRNKYFIPTKFHQNPSSGSGEEFENVKRIGQKFNNIKCALSLQQFEP